MAEAAHLMADKKQREGMQEGATSRSSPKDGFTVTYFL
jgi:hypothetical protein